MYQDLALQAVFVLVYSSVAGAVERTWISGPILLYAIVSLTLIRMLPVFLSLAGAEQNTEGKLLIGWFGPRGLASILFAVIVLNANLPHGGAVAMVVVCTVLLGILAHGVTASPRARVYGERMRRSNSA